MNVTHSPLTSFITIGDPLTDEEQTQTASRLMCHLDSRQSVTDDGTVKTKRH